MNLTLFVCSTHENLCSRFSLIFEAFASEFLEDLTYVLTLCAIFVYMLFLIYYFLCNFIVVTMVEVVHKKHISDEVVAFASGSLQSLEEDMVPDSLLRVEEIHFQDNSNNNVLAFTVV